MMLIVTLVCYAIQIILAISIFRRKDIDMVAKLIAVLIVILPPYMIGAAFYYFYAQYHIARWTNR